MTWGRLKEIVEEYHLFNDDTEIIIYDGKQQLRHKTGDLLYHDAKERIVLVIKDYGKE